MLPMIAEYAPRNLSATGSWWSVVGWAAGKACWATMASGSTSLVGQRSFALVVVMMVVLGIVAVRLAYVQLVHGDHYRQQVAQARLLRDLHPGQRGPIIDRHGVVLVDNRIAVDVCLPLRDLAAPRAVARKSRLLAFDQTAKQRLLGRLAVLSRLDLESAELSRRLEELYVTSPLVGRRRIAVERGAKPELFLVPHAALAALAPQPDDAELMIAFRSEQLASLAAAGP